MQRNTRNPAIPPGRECRQSGFSLIELMIAMLITLIVSGAIFGLLSAGQNAFRREPELADMQQSIRSSMAVIQNDVMNAGLGMSYFAQVFSRNLDNLAGSPNSAIAPGQRTDALELFRVDETCDQMLVCKDPAGAPAGGPVDVAVPKPSCFPSQAQPGLIGLVRDAGSTPAMFTIGYIAGPAPVNPISPGGLCNSGTANGVQYNVPNNQGPLEWRVSNAASTGAWKVAPFKVVRYQVAPDPTDGAPALWRSDTGGRDVSDNFGAVQPIPSAAWQMVARGVEDLQVLYTDGNLIPNTQPTVVSVPVPPPGNYLTLTQSVTVTLSARALAFGLTGQTAVAGIPGSAVRTQLTAQITPRPALLALQLAGTYR